MANCMNWLRRGFVVMVIVVASIGIGGLSASADAAPTWAAQSSQTLVAYSLDYEMDRARGDQTIEHYGEAVREPVEQALKNNVNNPESKDTAENSYGRKSFWNNLLPNRHSAGKNFSQDDFSGMRKIVHPKDVLKKNGGAPLERALE